VLYLCAVDRENPSHQAQVERAVAAARRKMAVAVECWLLPVNWVNKDALHRLHSGRYRPVHHPASGVFFPDFLCRSVL
jgi:hypothetical protein